MNEEPVCGYPAHYLQRLINAGSARNAEQARRLLEALRAIEDGNAEMVRQYLRGGLDPNATLFSGYGNLLRCALERNRNPDVVRALLDAGVDLKQRWLLSGVVKLNDASLVAEVLAKDIVKSPAELNLSLVEACWEGNAEIAKLLLAHGADVNTLTEVYPANKEVSNHTPLMIAAGEGHVKLVRLLLAAGAKVQAVDSSGRTALDWARTRRSKRAKKVAVLLEQAGARAIHAGPAPGELVPDFGSRAKAAEFQGLLRRLRELTGDRPRRIEPEEETVRGGYAFLVEPMLGKEIVRQLQEELAGQECLVFLSRDITNKKGACVVALPTSNWGEAVSALQTAGPNSDVSTAEVVAWLTQVEKEQPLQITEIGADFLRGRFTTPLKDPVGLAASINRLCPDGDDGPGATERLAAHLTATGELFLWWD